MNACHSSDIDEPEIYPIRFPQPSYTVKMGITSSIFFVDGGDEYIIEIGNPDVIGKAEIDINNHNLYITPISIGESTITINDIRALKAVQLHITVVDFYLSFNVVSIDGENNNPYIRLNDELRYIRTDDNRKPFKIMYHNPLNYEVNTIAEGTFDFIRGDSDFSLEMALHRKTGEELEAFTYTAKGPTAVFDVFNLYFGFGWEKLPQSKGLPVQRLNLELIDHNGCTINTILMPLSYQ